MRKPSPTGFTTSAHRRHHEPAVLRDAGRRPHPPRRGSAPSPLGIFHAAAGRTARRHHLGPLRPRRRRLAGRLRFRGRRRPHRLHHGHRRPRLCQAGHRLRHPAHRHRALVRARNRHRPGGPRRRRGSAARRRHRTCAAETPDRPAPRPVDPVRPGPRPVRQACQPAGRQARHREARSIVRHRP